MFLEHLPMLSYRKSWQIPYSIAMLQNCAMPASDSSHTSDMQHMVCIGLSVYRGSQRPDHVQGTWFIRGILI
jgi:hypothetical protein